MEKQAYLDAIRRSTPLIAAVAREAPSRPVPSCPGWAVADLLVHLGGVQRFWTAQIGAGAEPLQMDDEEFARFVASVPGLREWADASWEGKADPAALPAGTVEWFEEGARRLEETLAATDPASPVWHWSGDNTARSTLRMQAIEATLHRWDAQNAVGAPEPIDLNLAVDGIDHALDVMLPARRRWKEPRAGSGETYHFHRTDGPGEWVLRFDPDGPVVSREHAKGDVAVRASAADLFLFLWGRADRNNLEILGDPEVLDRYTELVPPG